MDQYCHLIRSAGIAVTTVLEIGSRDGDDAARIADFFDVAAANVWVCEANPRQAEVIARNYPEFNLIDKAIFDQPGTLRLWQMDGDPQLVGTTSLLDRSADNLYDQATIIEVEAISGKRLMDAIPGMIGACKIDVEGATLQVLRSLEDSIHRIQSFHLECEHREVWSGQHQYDEVAAFMVSQGFEQIDFAFVIPDVQSDSVWIQKPRT